MGALAVSFVIVMIKSRLSERKCDHIERNLTDEERAKQAAERDAFRIHRATYPASEPRSRHTSGYSGGGGWGGTGDGGE